MRKLFTILTLLILFWAFSFFNARYHVRARATTQQCYPVGLQIKGEPLESNAVNSISALVSNTAPGNVVDIPHGTMFNFIFDPQLGTIATVDLHPTVNHATGWTPPSYPIASEDFNVSISPNNPSKLIIQFQPAETHQLAVGDTICASLTFQTGGPVTAPVTFYSSVTGFGQNLPSNTITVY